MDKIFLLLLVFFFAVTMSYTKNYKDGEYTAKAMGYVGDIEVKVKIKDSKIKSVDIISNKENRPLTALEKVPNRIVKDGSYKVDGVTGATYTSNGIKKAVKKALKKAVINKCSTKSSKCKGTKKNNSYSCGCK